MFRKYKDIILEAITWFSVFTFAILVSILFPWDIATDLLRNIAVVAGCAAVFWYLRSRRLWQESQEKSRELSVKQRELISRNRTINLIFNSAADGILVLDDHLKIVTFSPGLEAITGFRANDVIGKAVGGVLQFKGNRENGLLPEVMFSCSTQKRPHIKNSLTTKDGREIDIEASCALIREPSSTKALAIIRDMTYENELVQRDKEFIAMTSHQLNTPLSIIQGYLSLLAKHSGELNRKQGRYLEEIVNAVHKMIALTNNMLSISRIEQEKIKLQKVPLNLTDFLDKLYSDFSFQAKKKNIQLIFPSLTSNLTIMADKEKLDHVLSNLLDNAIKYTNVGSVTLDARKQGDTIAFSITDTGMGISEDELQKVGQKFYRSQDAVNVDNKGTGLGLFIARTIIEKHGGTFKISSKLGKGSIFQFTIPLGE